MITLTDHILETDVLVIGGDLAGCFAAVRTREKDANVILVRAAMVSRASRTVHAGYGLKT